MKRSIDFIQTEFARPIRLADLASQANLSRFHFHREFRRATGLSPYRMLLEARLSAADSLLRHTRLSISEAAIRAGFTDLSRFSQMYRKRFGMRPRDVSRTRCA